MSEERKSLVWPWVVALLVALTVLYVASFGPACRLCHREMFTGRATWITYRPVIWISFHGPTQVGDAIQRYAHFCIYGEEFSINSNAGYDVRIDHITGEPIDNDPFAHENMGSE